MHISVRKQHIFLGLFVETAAATVLLAPRTWGEGGGGGKGGGKWGVRMPTASMFDPDALSHKPLKAIGPIDSEDIDIEADCSQMGTTKSVYVEIEADLTPAALSPISFSSESGNTTSGP